MPKRSAIQTLLNSFDGVIFRFHEREFHQDLSPILVHEDPLGVTVMPFCHHVHLSAKGRYLQILVSDYGPQGLQFAPSRDVTVLGSHHRPFLERALRTSPHARIRPMTGSISLYAVPVEPRAVEIAGVIGLP